VIPKKSALLAQYVLFQRCRKLIEEKAGWQEQVNLMAVSQVLTNLKYNDPELLDILGGKKIMLESPVLQKLIAETKHDYILKLLQSRFGSLPKETVAHVRRIRKEKRLDVLFELAMECKSLEEFQEKLHS
jgi:hypothetical protein